VSGAEGVNYITVQGDFVFGDEVKFISLALPLGRATVVFNSDGGDLRAGIEIGKAIRLKEFSTMVPVNGTCASACGLAWLAVLHKYIDVGARVGFHAAY